MVKVVGVGPGAHLEKCWNEETFRDFLPVAEVAAAGELFISASGHGIGCDELVEWLLYKREWINPMSTLPFTHQDIAAIRAWDRPQISRLQVLEEEAATRLMLASERRGEGDWREAQQLRVEAGRLAPDHPGLAAFDAWVPPVARATLAARLATGSRAQNRPSAPPPTPASAVAPPRSRSIWRTLFGSK